ncbi:hypothetical protein C3486_28505 [Streptomyces sp. Ru73]|uniref:hypothetical protein n=1 Tax=Streptomyces sp. Ru73 TaxID=2080748 RepID=UPI000CDD01FC|nr:hypothetical protein [Streptomyces sp. Ru73]POX37406.1 hypothetical protein C3486_28505 [Streptomyces sp. Ru73]
MKQGQCPDCGSAEVFPIEVNRHQGGSIFVRLRDTYSLKRIELITLACGDCGLIRQYAAEDTKTRNHLRRAFIRPPEGPR